MADLKNPAITENHLYKKTYSKGKRSPQKYITVYILRDYCARSLAKANPLHVSVNRLGLTVSKKIGNAVCRSRVRRILREAYRQLEKSYTVSHGYLVVIAAREAAVGAKTADIFRDLRRASIALGLIDETR